MSVAQWCSMWFCVNLCVGFCTGHFVMVSLNLTYIQCLHYSFFEHLFNLYSNTGYESYDAHLQPLSDDAWSCSTGSLLHQCLPLLLCDVGCGWRIRTRLSKTSQRCSLGDRSRLNAGQGRTFTLLLVKEAGHILALCGRAVLCWNLTLWRWTNGTTMGLYTVNLYELPFEDDSWIWGRSVTVRYDCPNRHIDFKAVTFYNTGISIAFVNVGLVQQKAGLVR